MTEISQTTTTAQAPAVPAPPPAPAAGEVDDVDARAASIIADIHSGKYADGDEGDEGDEPAVVEAEGDAEDADDVAKPEPQEPATAAEKERKERIARAQELERKARDESKKAVEYRERLEAQFRARHEQFLQREQALAEKERAADAVLSRLKDPATRGEFLREHFPPQELGEYLAEEMDPRKAAEYAARRQLNPELAALRKEIQELRQEREQSKQRDLEAQRVAHGEQIQRQAEQAFTEHTKSVANAHPYAAELLELRPKDFLARAHNTATRLVARHGNTDYPSILKELESELSGTSVPSSPQSPGETHTRETVTDSAAPVPRARTLTTRNSTGRSTMVVDDESLGTLNDRAEDLKRRLRKSG